MMLRLWLAQGFGSGRAPVAPGTFGSIVGLAWFLLLLSAGSWGWFIAANIAGFFASIWLCGQGERILQKKDPGSVVIDEIVAMPCCYIVWMLAASSGTARLPKPSFFLQHWPATLIIFGLFRLFDTWKPWPVRQSQNLPGGVGVTVDDFLAAAYVNLVMGAALIFFG